MLGADKDGKLYKGALDVVQRTAAENPNRKIAVFFSGIQPRVMWISIGGFVFFGAYEGFKTTLLPVIGWTNRRDIEMREDYMVAVHKNYEF